MLAAGCSRSGRGCAPAGGESGVRTAVGPARSAARLGLRARCGWEQRRAWSRARRLPASGASARPLPSCGRAPPADLPSFLRCANGAAVTSLLDAAGVDTALARRLLAGGRCALADLRDALEEARAERSRGRTLARELCERGLLPAAELEALVAELAVPEPPPGPDAGAAPEPAPGEALRDARAGTAVLPDGGAPKEAAGLRPGAVLARYRLRRRLGAGGMGVVFLAEEVALGRLCALKVLPEGVDPEIGQRFVREAEAQARADRHPNVVRVHDCGIARGRLYLAMQYAPGGNLAERLEGGEFQDPRAAAAVVRDLARGLAHVHGAGVLHRDLKPQNVLFDEQNTPLLADFGMARLVEGVQRLTRSGDVLGTPSYMAPEQARGDPRAVDERSDVYGLGAILYRMLAGRPPHQARSVLATLAAVASDEVVPPRRLRPEVPPELEAICLRALAKAKGERPPSAAALADELDVFLAGAPTGRRPSSRAVALPVLGALAAAGALAAVGAAVGLAHARRDAAPASAGARAVASARSARAAPAERGPAERGPAARAQAERVAWAGKLEGELERRRWGRVRALLEGPSAAALSPELRQRLAARLRRAIEGGRRRPSGLYDLRDDLDLHLSLLAVDPSYYAGERFYEWWELLELSATAQASVWASEKLRGFARDALLLQPEFVRLKGYFETLPDVSSLRALRRSLGGPPVASGFDPEGRRRAEERLVRARQFIRAELPFVWHLVERIRPEALLAVGEAEGAQVQTATALRSLLHNLSRYLDLADDREGLRRLEALVCARASDLPLGSAGWLRAEARWQECALLQRKREAAPPDRRGRLESELREFARRAAEEFPQDPRFLGCLLGLEGAKRASVRRAFLAACAGKKVEGRIGLDHWEAVAGEELAAISTPDREAASAAALWPLPRAEGRRTSWPVLSSLPKDAEGLRPLRVAPALLARIALLVARHRPERAAEVVACLEASCDEERGRWNEEAARIVPRLRSSLERSREALLRRLEQVVERLPLKGPR
ncbi:MAG: serine/threonine protein kinase [Planctomycetota bacterium]|nr:MAG: serine/threonine protein kinase [Planctomycetota bacterium]